MDLDKVIKQTQDCVWQLKKLDIDDKYEQYSMERLMAEISAEVKGMKDNRVVTLQEMHVTNVPAVPYQENMSQNKFLRKIDEKLSSGRIYQGIRLRVKKAYRFFVPYLTVSGDELLKYEGEMFARVAYKSILQREIDKEALANVVNSLEARRVTKIDLLNTLCKSEEGKKHGIVVRGLRSKLLKQNLKNGLKRIPVLGYALRWIKCIILLPRMFANTQNSINDLVLYDKKKTNQLSVHDSALDALRNDLAFAVADLQGKLIDIRRDLEFVVEDFHENIFIVKNNFEVLVSDQYEKRNEQEKWLREQYATLAAKVRDAEESIEENIFQLENNLTKLKKEELHIIMDDVEQLEKKYDRKIASLLDKLIASELEIKELITLQSKLEQWLVQDRVFQKETELKIKETRAMQKQISEQLFTVNLEQRENIQQIANIKHILDNTSKAYDGKLALLEEVSSRNEKKLCEVSSWQEAQIQKECIKTNNMLETKELLDKFYVTYNEKLMSDSREEIIERQAQYLPFIESHMGNKKQELVMLDLGCGEGEFIELLNSKGYPAYGIDSNPIVIRKVKNIRPAIRIIESDAIEYLAGMPSGSVDFISCFHMVEHLETIELLKLLKEMYRVLKVGGSIILETPNPLNILISTYYFNMDPTHKKTIPSELLKLMVSNAGFKVEECRMLRPLCFVPYNYDDPNDKIKDIVFRFNMEQAYSIMAVKE